MERYKYKIYDPEISDVCIGVQVAEIVMDEFGEENEDNLKTSAEKCVTQKLKNLSVSNIRKCSYCKVSFNDICEQRSHYKLDWHRYNLKRALRKKPPVTEDVFDSMADDVSSISGSETESSGKEDADLKINHSGRFGDEVKILTLAKHPKAFFVNFDEAIFSVYKCLLFPKKEIIPGSLLVTSLCALLDNPRKWMIIMLGGGHFAAAIFNNNEIAEHKTFHSYTVRAKQGSSQSSRDNKGSGHSRSAGASLRRHNEQTLIQNVHETIKAWSESIKQCQLILYRAPGRYNRRIIFGGKNAPLDKNDRRLRGIPFPTNRPTLKEVKRVHDVLCTFEIFVDSSSRCNYKFPRLLERRSLTQNTDMNDVNEVQTNRDKAEKIAKKKEKASRKFDRSKARSSPQREIPGQSINDICRSDSSDDDEEEEEAVLTSDNVDINFDELKEYDGVVDDDAAADQNLTAHGYGGAHGNRAERSNRAGRYGREPRKFGAAQFKKIARHFASASYKKSAYGFGAARYDPTAHSDADADADEDSDDDYVNCYYESELRFAFTQDEMAEREEVYWKLHSRQFRTLNAKMHRCCQRKDKDGLVELLKLADTLPKTIPKMKRTFDGNLLTKKDFYKCLSANIVNKARDTLLHVAASLELPEFVTLLLEAGADPTVKNKYNFTPFVMSGSKETKNAFKEFVAKYPDKVDYKKANIPAPMSEEMIQMNIQRKREKNKIKRLKSKNKKREIKEKMEEEEEKRKFLALSDKEKFQHVLAFNRKKMEKGEKPENEKGGKPAIVLRCFLCGVDISTKIPFEYGENRFCSIPCVKAHRSKNKSYGIDI